MINIIRQKISKTINYLEEIDLRKYISPDHLESLDSKFIFELYGVVVHLGGTLDGGHYISYVKNPMNQWCLFDDSQVALKNFFSVQTGAYILFYRKKWGLDISKGRPEAQCPELGRSVSSVHNDKLNLVNMGFEKEVMNLLL